MVGVFWFYVVFVVFCCLFFFEMVGFGCFCCGHAREVYLTELLEW